LQLITPDFMDISFVKINDHGLTRTAKIRLRGTPHPVPLGSMGDGMLRVLQITLKIFAARGGLLLIDEFENGLHYSVQEKIWNLIFQLAEQLDICCIPCDHIPIRSRPLFWARDMMRGLIETLKAEQST